jgi:transposase
VYSEEFREMVANGVDNGVLIKDIKKIYGCSGRSHQTWMKNKKKYGTYCVPANEKRTRRIEINEEELKEELEKNPDSFLRELAVKFNCSKTTMHNKLKSMNYTRKNKTFTYKEANPVEQEKFLNWIKDMPPHMLTYIDEVGTNKHFVRKKVRSPRGTIAEGTIEGSKPEKLNIIGARCVDENGKIIYPSIYMLNENVTSSLFMDWFVNHLLPVLPKGRTIIMDNATFHPKNKIREIVKEYTLNVKFLPPYSPEFNEIEKTWGTMNTDFSNKGIKSTLKDKYSAVINFFKDIATRITASEAVNTIVNKSLA